MSLDNYNGYTNRETWLVCLWINNDENAQRHWLTIAADITDRGKLADFVEATYQDQLDSQDHTGMWLDLFGTALARVDWLEVADNLLSD